VVAQYSHPEVRRFAVDHLAERILEPNFVELFTRNWQPGDEQLILACWPVSEVQDDLHGLTMDIVKALENNPTADCQALGLLAYRLTPCPVCRFHGAQLLFRRNVAPPWLIEECAWDSSSDTRKLADRPPHARKHLE
jgi:hypothetical protein